MGRGSVVYLFSSGKKEDILEIQQYLYKKWYIARLLSDGAGEGIVKIDVEVINSDIDYKYAVETAGENKSKDLYEIKEGSAKAGTFCLMIYATWHAHKAISKYLTDYEAANNVSITSFDYSSNFGGKHTILDENVTFEKYEQDRLLQSLTDTTHVPALNCEFDKVKELILNLIDKYHMPVFSQINKNDSELIDFVNMLSKEKIMYGDIDTRYLEDNKIKNICYYGTSIKIDRHPGSSSKYDTQINYMTSNDAPIYYTYDFETDKWICDRDKK